MTAFSDALEAFNRETHSDALREMQLVPAEPQTIVGTGIGWVVPMALVIVFVSTVVWANSGASPSGTEALVLADQAPTGLAASRVDPLAGDR